MDYQTVLNEVESWPIVDRVRLVQDLWERLGTSGDDPVLTDAQKAELDRRIEEMERNPGAGIPWEVARARVLRRFGR